MPDRRIVLDEQGVAHLDTVVTYNWDDELRDFRDHPGETDCHIFVALVALDNLVNGTAFTPEDYLPKEEPHV